MSKTKAQLIEEARYLKSENESLQALCDSQNRDLNTMHHRLRNVIDERIGQLQREASNLCDELSIWRRLNDLGASGYEVYYTVADYGYGWYTDSGWTIDVDGKVFGSDVSLLHAIKKVIGKE